MDVPLNAQVRCADGPCGQSTRIVLNPTTDQVTHVVVKEQSAPHAERLVDLNLVTEATPQVIRLRCTGDQLADFEPFVTAEFVEARVPRYSSGVYMMPYVTSMDGQAMVETESVPRGELAVQRGARVEATDGAVGRVDEFLLDPRSQRVTHLVLRQGHLWGQRDVTIPISQIELISENAVYLKLDKQQVEALPTVPIAR
jgi:sporulation protein YlmC with PRC-barrel domain